jgi:CRP-like cAMP-binding protein
MDTALFRRLNQLILLNPKQQADLWRVVVPMTAPKGTILLESGAVCECIYFALTGVIRAYSMIEGKEVTQWFCFPNHFGTDYFSFVYRRPGEICLQAIMDATVLSLSYQSLQDLCRQDPIWIDLNRRLLEQYYLALQSRVLAFQTQSTAQRYRQIVAEYPEIETAVPLGYLASYLGMSQETLSRLRQRRDRLLAN